jgi:hypothetical protein
MFFQLWQKTLRETRQREQEVLRRDKSSYLDSGVTLIPL